MRDIRDHLFLTARLEDHVRELIRAVDFAPGTVHVEDDRLNLRIIKSPIEVAGESVNRSGSGDVREYIRAPEDWAFDRDSRHTVSLGGCFCLVERPAEFF